MVVGSLAAAKRLRKELQVLRKQQQQSTYSSKSGDSSSSHHEHDDIYLRPANPEHNLLLWKAWLRGPVDTPYQGGVFALDIRCGPEYPLAPPTIKFLTKVFHPNVHFRTGDICLDILKKEWSPAWGLQAACRAVLALLSDPDATSPLNCDAGNMVRGGDLAAFDSTAAMYTAENAMFWDWPKPAPIPIPAANAKKDDTAAAAAAAPAVVAPAPEKKNPATAAAAAAST